MIREKVSLTQVRWWFARLITLIYSVPFVHIDYHDQYLLISDYSRSLCIIETNPLNANFSALSLEHTQNLNSFLYNFWGIMSARTWLISKMVFPCHWTANFNGTGLTCNTSGKLTWISISNWHIKPGAMKKCTKYERQKKMTN